MIAIRIHGGPRAFDMAKSSRLKTATPDRVQTDTEARSMSYETFFNIRFQKFLHENFDNFTQAAAVFGVRERTAENWWNGMNAPSGAKVGRAFAKYPESAIRHLTGEKNEADRTGHVRGGA